MNCFRYRWNGESISDKRKEVMQQLKRNRLPKTVYALVLPENDSSLLNIITGNYLKQDYYKKSGMTVVGAAGSKEEAMELSAQILDMIYKRNGNFDLKAYIREAEEAAT